MQNSGPWDPWLLAVKNSRLFGQRGHSARCAPLEEEEGGGPGGVEQASSSFSALHRNRRPPHRAGPAVKERKGRG